MITKQELLKWAATVGDNDGIFIDEGGLALHSEAGDYIEVGGDPVYDEEDEDEK